MKILLVGINAKFIHSNLAIRYLKKYAKEKTGFEVSTVEYSINNSLNLIIRELIKQDADAIGFSCYIWNIEIVQKLISTLKKLIPQTLIFAGGPEVSYNTKQETIDLGCDLIINGEGEAPFCNLTQRLINSEPYYDIDGISYIKDGELIINKPANAVSLDDIPFVYDSFEKLDNKIIYYETSRGCPFNCQYCLSSAVKGVRFLPLERVYSDLNKFIKAKVKQVKFIDRTFNCNKQHTMAIWKHLASNDNGYTNFHFEIAVELLDDEMVTFLNTVRKGLFQLEIGVQSTNLETLKAIKRNTDTKKLTKIVAQLQLNKNIHLHLDLIAGLPFEDYKTFANSFNFVHSLNPDQLQLGFLKLLKGSGLKLKADEYGIIPTDFPPYEVQKTNSLSYIDVLNLKMIEEMVEIFYNTNRHTKAMRLITSLFDTPFLAYEKLAKFYEQNNLHLVAHSKLEYHTILYNFINTVTNDNETITRFKWLALFDYCLHEKPNKALNWLDVSKVEGYKKSIYDFLDDKQNIKRFLPEYTHLDTKQILRNSHIEVFDFNPISNINKPVALLFNYKQSDLLGNANFFEIDL